MKTNGLRQLLIYGMTRQQQINFILRKDNSFTADSFANHTDNDVRNVALTVDKNFRADSNKNKNIRNFGGTVSRSQTNKK